MSDLNISTRSMNGVTVLDLSGRVALGDSSAKLHETVRALTHEGRRSVLLNLTNVKTIDSSGLGSLIAAFATLQKDGGHLALTNLPPKVADLMTITKLHTVFDIFEDETTAINSFATVRDRITQPLDIAAVGNRKANSSVL